MKPLVCWSSHCGWGKSLWDLRNMLWVGLTERVRCGCEVRGVCRGRKTPFGPARSHRDYLSRGLLKR